MHKSFKLSPAQHEFLCASIPEFYPGKWSITLAAQAGSERRFIRIRQQKPGNASYVMIIWDAHDQDWPRFMSIAQEVAASHSLLPKIFAVEPAHGLILEEDLGSTSLKKAVLGKKSVSYIEKQYIRVIDALLSWQSHDVLPSSTVSMRRMDEEMFLWESDYFAKHCATEFFGLERLLKRQWNDERRLMAHKASVMPRVCMHRDFQSENVMICDNRVRFVDFQGARLGPGEYDLAALIYDPYVPCLTPELSDSLYAYYAEKCGCSIERKDFLTAASQRLLQALGAFCNLSLHKGKDWYREYIPLGLKRLYSVLEQTDEFPAVRDIVHACISAQSKKK